MLSLWSILQPESLVFSLWCQVHCGQQQSERGSPSGKCTAIWLSCGVRAHSRSGTGRQCGVSPVLLARCASTPCCDTSVFHLILNVKPAVLWCTSIMFTGTLTRRYYGGSISTWWPVLTCVRIKSFVLSSRPSSCWVIQTGLLTPLTFARHCLSPFAAFTSGAYFLHNGRQWQWICKFYTAKFKGIFGGL